MNGILKDVIVAGEIVFKLVEDAQIQVRSGSG
jgi:hypothetical protein